MTPWLVAAALTAGAGVLAWPQRSRRSTAPLWRARGAGLAGRMRSGMDPGGHPVRFTAAVAGCAAAGGWWAAGGVAALLAAGYAALAGRALGRRLRDRRAEAARRAALDDLCGLAADLRAGLPPAAHWLGVRSAAHGAHAPSAINASMLDPAPPTVDATAASTLTPAPPTLSVTAASTPASSAGASGSVVGRIERLAAAVWHLAERTGAPAADLVERIEADARAAHRARSAAAAQAAGARATAVLLAALPIGGIALGYAIGTDPLAVLLHTPIGAGCAVAALLLQMAGLAWTGRLLGTRR